MATLLAARGSKEKPMQLEKFVEKHLAGYKDMPPAWQHEVVLILGGHDSLYSANQRGVTRDAVKAQRKKIFKYLKVADGRELMNNLFRTAVSNLK
jgi:hypothetical protein